MRKIFALFLAAALTLSLTACSAPKAPKGNSSSAPSIASTPAPLSTSLPASSSEPVIQAEKYVTPEDYIQGYGQAMMPKGDDTPVVITYHPAVKALSDLLKKDLPWPTELTEDWKGWGYSEIVITDAGFSLRTTLQKNYYAKHSDQIASETKKMKTVCPEITYNDRGQGANGVPYSELTVPSATDIKTVKDVAYSALFLQAWSLIPEQFQGVTVTVGDKAYTLDEILAA